MGLCIKCNKIYKKDGGRAQKLCLKCWTIIRTKPKARKLI
jgi:hypothetical protein